MTGAVDVPGSAWADNARGALVQPFPGSGARGPGPEPGRIVIAFQRRHDRVADNIQDGDAVLVKHLRAPLLGSYAATASLAPAMNREFDVVVEMDADGYYVASVPALQGCHTQARSLDKLMVRIQEAIALCLEVEGLPATSSKFIGVQRVSVAL